MFHEKEKESSSDDDLEDMAGRRLIKVRQIDRLKLADCGIWLEIPLVILPFSNTTL